MVYKTLRGAIIDRFGTLQAFANEIGWSGQRLGQVIKNPGEIPAKHLKTIFNALGLTELNSIAEISLLID